MACWWCEWGWPKQIADIFIDAVEKLGGDDFLLRYGPAHIVWEDENFDSAEWCIENFDKYSEKLTDYEKSVILESLKKLKEVPHEYKIAPYSDLEPEKFPPPNHWECVKINL